jgi:protein TonB
MTSTIQIAKYGTIDDLLFRGKNKSYGAYQLRQEYEHRLRRAFFLFMATLTSIAVIVPVYNLLMGNLIIVDNGSSPKGTVYNANELTDIKIEEPKIEIPKTAQDLNSVALLPPKIVDEVPQVDMNSTEEVLNSEAVISNENHLGSDILKPTAEPIIVAPVSPGGSQNIPYDPNVAFDIVTDFPEFPGDIQDYMANRIDFPGFEKDLGITSGLVVVGFVVNEDGSLSNVHLEKEDRENFNNLALRAIKSMPKWKPGMNNGHKVKVNISLPISFKIDD